MIFQIENAKEKDIPQIIALIREFAEFENLSDYCEVTEESLFDAIFGTNPCLEGLTALNDDESIGYALFYENFASFRGQRGLYLEDLYIKPEYRGHKIGEAFLKELAQIARERNFKRIDFLVLDWNEPAIGFYKKLGAEMDADERHFRFVGKAFEELSK
ncbi:MAG: GNAT family N-acetyltransferase [Acidobacteria bacterium]|jgi:ribosomal protein S18 acetylase RimI-like enzyme|nr:GNAT family N-acetyltransferase [Acidobacteriota bacterium]MBA4183317.1 GNAT family N-acetyltransferase [Acidobacteriota bacterium]